MTTEETADTRPPDPDDPRKPDSPTDLTKRSWLFVARKTAREFQDDQCTDLAAALTYYAVLSIFPALVVIVSLLGVFGQGKRTTDTLLEIAGGLLPGSALENVRQPIQQLVENPSAGVALAIGMAGALWSASGYIGAFGRAMNRIYEIEEGRPVWKLRPLQLVLTLVGLVMVAAVAFMLAVSGPVAEAVGNAIGAGSVAVTAWSILKWPVILVCVVAAVAILYYAAPNVKQPRVPMAQCRRRCRDSDLDRRVGVVRLLRRQFRQLQQDLWSVGRRHRVPALVVDHQPFAAVRCRTRRRTRARPPAASGHAGRA